MGNPFSIENLVPSWVKATVILKGDFAGHPFRGNQHTGGISAADSPKTFLTPDEARAAFMVTSPLAVHVARDMANRAQVVLDDTDTSREAAEIHDKLARDHRAAAYDARRRYENWGNPRGNSPEAQARREAAKFGRAEMEAHLDATRAHDEAALANREAARYGSDDNGRTNDAVSATTAAEAASESAYSASKMAASVASLANADWRKPGGRS